MAEDIIALTIDRIAGLGDGVGTYNGRKVFVPYTIAGDVIEVRIVKRTADTLYGTLHKILTPGNGRIRPPCRHSGECGGCTLQHVAAPLYLAFKQDMAREAVRKAGFNPDCVDNAMTFAPDTRRRVELKAGGGRLGFYAGQSHRIVDMEDCRVMEPELLVLVLRIREQLHGLAGISGIQINGVDGGYDVVAEGKDGRRLHVADCSSVLRLSIREGKETETIYQSGEVALSLGGIKVAVPAGAFLQASRPAQEYMTKRVTEAAGNAGSVLDLFAGIGTYSFPLSVHASVTAIEGDAGMTRAMQDAAATHPIRHSFKPVLRDLFRSPVTAKELGAYDAVVINPPRTGAKAQSEELARSHIPRIVMVSCNPATFTRDARLLKDGGYHLKRLTPVDQFIYSSHLELIAEFTR